MSNNLKGTIYLVKDGITTKTQLLKGEGYQDTSIEMEGATATLYVKDVTKSEPTYVDLFASQNLPDTLDFGTNQLTGAVLKVFRAGHTFFICFGQGHHLLEKSHLVSNFGLRTAINSIDVEKIRSMDTASNKATLLNSRFQSGLGAEMNQLPVDIDEDMLSAIVGISKDTTFVSKVAGRKQALNVTLPNNLNKLPTLLDKAWQKYNAALPAELKWVENIAEVTKKATISKLNQELLKQLNSKQVTTNDFYLMEPEVIEHSNIIGYAYKARSKQVSDFLSLTHYLSEIKKKKSVITLGHLTKDYKIYAHTPAGHINHSWSGFECLYGELVLNHEHYALRNGTWYEINKDFVKEVNDALARIDHYQYSLPVFNHKDEGSYNEGVANSTTHIECMDKKNIWIGGKQSRFEFCDLVNKANGYDHRTDMIHVKHYTSSATLSHLFSQGTVSAEIFRSSEEARTKLYNDNSGVMPLSDPKQKPVANDYRVVYAIYGINSLPTALPFFSKVNLKNAFNRLQTLGYEVALAHIPLAGQKLQNPLKKVA
ncbi:conserved hypothetical protein [Vibrio chagasii]|nr:conserved hypothetical protein [Vibrio chagasii]CAH6849084.1 conserved hypothetical protein [Vibrio chagasii]CAH6853902.1 conserved hypothetical protein [Vibrio chagasii]CAH7056267.1 conserved hypothetical protein [Vibrio chagasii]CAH7095122.1 conserved hypothetical protein [Vibrio chagasii]